VNSDDEEKTFYCDDVTSNRYVNSLIGMPVKDGGSRFITDSDIDFEIDEVIVMNDGTKKRITEIPEVRIKGNNARRGVYRKDRVLVTT
jgi:hypothetical protein